MSIQQAETSAPTRTSLPPGGRRGAWPSDWLLIALGAAYVAAVAVLVLLPGATLIERLRALDGGICAQAGTHSFWPGGQQLPLCSRNTGIYVGFAATFCTLLALGRLRAARFPGRWVLAILAIAVLFMAVDGFNSFFLDLGLPHPYQPHNLLRLASGLGTGTAMCAILLPVANTLIWREEDNRPSFHGPRQLVVMAPVLLLAFLTVASQGPAILYPIAIFSTFGLVMALTLVNMVFLLGLSNQVGRFAALRQLVPFFTVAVLCAILELMALFALKTSMMHALRVP